MYPPCTSNWRFDCFYGFYRFVESISYVRSTNTHGSNPTLSASLLPLAPDPPIRGGLSRLTCRAVLARPVDMGGGSWGESRKVLRFFTRWVGKLLGSFSYAQTHQGFAHRLAVAVRA